MIISIYCNLQNIFVYRYLASGDSYKSITYSYRMSDRTVSNIVNEESIAVWNTMQPLYMPQPTMKIWKSIAKIFEHIWQFPHCVSALDGKHILIKKPPNSGSSFYSKHTFSVVLMALVDAHYKFISVIIGSMGRHSDSNIFSSGALAKKMNKQTLQLPQPALLLDYNQILPFVFVVDEAFLLCDNIMRPYPKRNSTGNFENKIFNYKTFASTTNCRMHFWNISFTISSF